MGIASDDTTCGSLNGFWDDYRMSMMEAARLSAHQDAPGEDAALNRAMAASILISATPARTPKDAEVKLKLALDEAKIAHGTELDPTWTLVQQALAFMTEHRAAAAPRI